MKRFRCFVVVLVVAVVTLAFHPTSAPAWGNDGHEAIGQVALDRLNPAAKTAVTELLGTMTIEKAAVWPDDIRKPRALSKQGEGKLFNTNFPYNPKWHFVNLPLDSTSYRLGGTFASKNDIVHAIINCIAKLEGSSSAPANMTKAQALRWLVHLCGDIHQPVHVGTGYYETDDEEGQAILIRNPNEVGPARTSDRGANLLHYAKNKNLHSYWDTVLVRKVAESSSDPLKKVVSDKIQDSNFAKNTGDYHRWAVSWATDSLKKSRIAYEGIDIGAWGKDSEGHDMINVEFEDEPAYETKGKKLVTEQLARGAYNLSELLNVIKWK